MTARADFLEAVSRAVALAGHAGHGRPEPPPPAGDLGGEPRAGDRRLAARFEEAAAQVQAVVHRAGTAADAAAAVVALTRERGVRHAVAWSAEALEGFGRVPEALVEAGILVTTCPTGSPGVEARAAFRQAAAAADLGLTGADLGVASSGSVLLRSGPGRARSVSLLPPVHVALLREAQLVATLAEAGPAVLAWSREGEARGGANLALVTGPSRTADIELILTRGVHGPREVHVVLVST